MQRRLQAALPQFEQKLELNRPLHLSDASGIFTFTYRIHLLRPRGAAPTGATETAQCLRHIRSNMRRDYCSFRLMEAEEADKELTLKGATFK